MKTSNKVQNKPFVKIGLIAGATVALVIATAVQVSAANNFVKFEMVRSPGLAAFPLCVPQAHGIVQITSEGTVEIMDVFFSGLPPNTDFDFFVIQVPNPPFGLCWYQGDVETDALGRAAEQFVGRFNVETFIVAPGVASAPIVFGSPNPSVGQNPQTGPVQIYHLGLWFNNPADAVKAGGPGTVTPFNGEHQGGVQVLNTSNFTGAGPLSAIQP
jgi:hypothetical protein